MRTSASFHAAVSPEQALGEPATPQGDLYSLGVVLYEMLTGELPYVAETPVGVVMQHVGGVSRSPRDADPDIPEEIDTIAGRLLSRNPEERYPDAATLAEGLERIVETLPQRPGNGVRDRREEGPHGARAPAPRRGGSARERYGPSRRRRRARVASASACWLQWCSCS